MSRKLKLSPAQRAMLVRLILTHDGDEMGPYGMPDSGRKASAWFRTAQSLYDLGAVTLHRTFVSIRPMGRRLVTDRWV